jgi:hypothetical protein
MPKADRLPFVEDAKLTDDHKMLLDWLNDAESSTPETDWRTNGPQDYKFYAGDQDTDEVKQFLQDQKRPLNTFNEVKPKIDMLIGLGAQTKFNPDVHPAGQEDEPLAELMKSALLHFAKKSKLVRREVECFGHAVKSGRSLAYFYIDKENPFVPRIKCKRIPGSNFVLDPQSYEYDMEDARYLFIDKWMSEDDIKAYWPHVNTQHIQQHVIEGYPLFWNEQDDLYRVVECWYRKYVKMRWFVNPLNEKVESLTPEDFSKFAKMLSEGIPQEDGSRTPPIPVPEFTDSMVRKVHYMIFSDIFMIEGGISPYKWNGFPAVLFGAYKNDNTNTWFGAIRMMIDPQVSLNTMRRQLLHLLQTLPKGILKHEAGAILNIDEYEKRSADPSFHLEIAKGQFDKVGFERQPPISPIYGQVDAVMGQSMKDASGVQDDLMGIQQTSREPGVTVQLRQQTGFAVLFILFDNFRESRLECGRILLSFIQQYVTDAEMIRVQGPQGAQLMQINSQMNPEVDGFNDITVGHYDLEIDETIENASMRLAVAQMLTDFSHNNPESIPPDLILEYANVPFTVKQRIREIWENQAKLQQENIDADRALKIVELSVKSGIEEKQIAASVEAAKTKQKERKDGSTARAKK